MTQVNVCLTAIIEGLEGVAVHPAIVDCYLFFYEPVNELEFE